MRASIVNHLNATFRKEIPEAHRAGLHAAVDPRPGIAGRLHASGCRIDRAERSSTWTQALQTFLAEARKRPELAGVNLAVQRRGAAGLRRRRSRQGAEGRHRRSATSTRRCRRSWAGCMSTSSTGSAGSGACSCRRKARSGRAPTTSASSTCATTTATWCRCRRCSARGRRSARSTPTASTSTARRRSPARPRPGYSSGQALDALEEVAKATLPSDISYDWADLSYQERKAAGNASRLFAPVVGLRVPDPRGALRELVAAVLGPAVGAGRGRRRVRRAADAAVTTSTSTPRSASSC